MVDRESPEAWALRLAWLGSNPDITSSLHFFFFLTCLFGCDGSSLLHGHPLVAVIGGCLLAVLCGHFISVASLVAEHRF